MLRLAAGDRETCLQCDALLRYFTRSTAAPPPSPHSHSPASTRSSRPPDFSEETSPADPRPEPASPPAPRSLAPDCRVCEDRRRCSLDLCGRGRWSSLRQWRKRVPVGRSEGRRPTSCASVFVRQCRTIPTTRRADRAACQTLSRSASVSSTCPTATTPPGTRRQRRVRRSK